MFATLKRDWKSILIQSVLTTVLFVGSIFTLAALLGSIERDQRVDTATARIVEEVRSVRELLCDALVLAENPALAESVARNCEVYE